MRSQEDRPEPRVRKRRARVTVPVKFKGGVIIRLRARRPVAARGAPGCGKCGSFFVVLEPAFVHCRYCGAMTRIVGGSLIAQEEFEMRSGLRLAS